MGSTLWVSALAVVKARRRRSLECLAGFLEHVKVDDVERAHPRHAIDAIALLLTLFDAFTHV